MSKKISELKSLLTEYKKLKEKRARSEAINVGVKADGIWLEVLDSSESTEEERCEADELFLAFRN